jgi:hypothetical protein
MVANLGPQLWRNGQQTIGVAAHLFNILLELVVTVSIARAAAGFK